MKNFDKIDSMVRDLATGYRVVNLKLNPKESYIEIYNKRDECICWFLEDSSFMTIYFPRIIEKLDKKDKEICHELFDFYLDNVTKYQ